MDNNFNHIRFIAALAVLCSHSIALPTGHKGEQPLLATCGVTLGDIAVNVFFVTSGFLISGSLFSRRSSIAFAWARMLRIWPALRYRWWSGFRCPSRPEPKWAREVRSLQGRRTGFRANAAATIVMVVIAVIVLSTGCRHKTRNETPRRFDRATYTDLEKVLLPGGVSRSIFQGRSFAIPGSPRTSGGRLLFANVGAVLRAAVPALAFVVPYHRRRIQPDDRVMRGMFPGQGRGRRFLEFGRVADVEYSESKR